MKLGILNEELGIVVIDSLEDLGHIQSEQIRRQMPEGANMNDLAFFYMADRDWVVINKSHTLYELYSQIIPIYLELSERSRKEFATEVPTEPIRRGCAILDSVIRNRALISRKAV